MLLTEIMDQHGEQKCDFGFYLRGICGLLRYSCGRMMALGHLTVEENDSQTNRRTLACVTVILSRPQELRHLSQNSSVGRRRRLNPRSSALRL